MRHIIYLLGPILLLTFACQEQETTDLNTANPAHITNNKPTSIHVAQASKKVFEHQIQAQGKLEARQTVNLQFRNANLIEKVYVQNGNHVKTGQLIAHQETDLLRTALVRAQQEVLVKKTDYLALCCDFGFCLGDTTKLTAKQKKQWMAQSGLSLALVNEKEATILLEQAKVSAPFSGIIANINQRSGDIAELSTPFCTLYNPSSLEVMVEVIESNYALMKSGLLADVRVLSTPNKVYKAILTRSNPVVNDKGMIQVFFKLQHASDLLPGMNASITIQIPTNQNIVVPKEAVVIRSGKSVVFTEKEGLAYWNDVTVGQENLREIEIIEGLNDGDRVIVTNNLQLAHETPVNIVNN